MTTDARISAGFPEHPKTRKLIRKLGQSAGWNLVRLFLWAAVNRSDGNLSGLSDEDIELAADWQGDEGTFVAVLVDVRFLDGEQGSYELHDWADHNPWAAGAGMRSAKARWNSVKRHHGAAEADRQVPEYAAVRAAQHASSNASSSPDSNAASNASSTPAASTQHASSNAPSPSPYPSPYPYPTPTLELPPTPQGGKRARKPSRSPEEETADAAMFEHHFWPVYPKKADKQAAYRAWRKLRVDAELLARILAGLELWKRHPQWAKDNGQFRHHASTWLNHRLWEDEEVCGGMRSGAAEKVPEWCLQAGFECVAEAHNRMCWEHNAHLFRDGKRIPEEAGA